MIHSKAEWSSFINHPGQSSNMHTNTRRKTVFVTGWRGTRGVGWGMAQHTADSSLAWGQGLPFQHGRKGGSKKLPFKVGRKSIIEK